MTSVTIEEAQARLRELIAGTPPGEGVLITRDDKPVAQLVLFQAAHAQPVLGSCKGKLVIVADDDEHWRDFAEYME